MMTAALLVLVLVLLVVVYVNKTLEDEVEYLTESKDGLFRSFELRTRQNGQLTDALFKLGVSPEWDNIDKGYLFYDIKPKKVKKVIKKKK